MSAESAEASSIVLKTAGKRLRNQGGATQDVDSSVVSGVRRGSMRTAFSGAGQTCWQMPQPVQTSGTTMGMICEACMAPGSGHRSMQMAQ